MSNLVEILNDKKITIATAESFTGGLLASSIVNMPHASNCFKGGIVSYTKEAKNKLLKISLDEIEKYGVYSIHTARLMALNVSNILDSNIGVGTTGVAGPGSDEGVSAGTLYYSIYYNNRFYDNVLYLGEDRNQNRIDAVNRIISDLIEIINM